MIQLKGSSSNHTTASNLSLSSAVRVYATNSGNVTIAAASGTSNHAGVLALVANEVIIITKQPTDTITCSAAMSCTPVGFHY